MQIMSVRKSDCDVYEHIFLCKLHFWWCTLSLVSFILKYVQIVFALNKKTLEFDQ
jgi:hypothetical protein